ncbi:hypothetical protein QUA35_02500 [Microcoleus sp. N9_B2]|uniref:hypothetical protein n=1 Tax=unclassified Microcoleus TaxID=2642155 RepID=UPI002FD0DA90
MSSKRYYILIGLMSLLLIGLGGCFDPANQNQTVVVNLIRDIPDTFEEEYLVRFDKGWGEYYKLEEGQESFLLIGASIEIPEKDQNKLLAQLQDTQANLQDIIASNPFYDTKSQVYALKVKLKVQATQESINQSFSSDIKVIFPAVTAARNRLGAKEPSSTPEISFSLKHHTKYSDYGLGRLFPDIISLFNKRKIFVTVLAVFFVSLLISSWNERKEAIVQVIWWLLAFIFFPLALFIIFPTLRNVFWIVSGLWGG